MVDIICKIAWKTVGRYGKATFLMLCVGFLFVITTSRAYAQLNEELSAPYVLAGCVSKQTELEKYYEVSSVDAATPMITFDTTLSTQGASLSGTITAVTTDYLDLTFLMGSAFPDESNMPFLVLNHYAAEHFITQEGTAASVSVNDMIVMTIQDQEVSSVICGIFEDGLEQPLIYMSYTFASRMLPKEEKIDLLFRLKNTEDLENAAKELGKLDVSVTYDLSLPERWKLTKQQIFQTFLSALFLLLCSAVQMAGQNKREQRESLPEFQALRSCGMQHAQIGKLLPLRALFADLVCFAVGITVAMIMQRISWFGTLCCTICFVLHFASILILFHSSHYD